VAAVAFHEHIGAGGQFVGLLEVIGVLQVQPRRGGESGAGVLHQALVLELLGMGDL
jgi:hypothetical protein